MLPIMRGTNVFTDVITRINDKFDFYGTVHLEYGIGYADSYKLFANFTISRDTPMSQSAIYECFDRGNNITVGTGRRYGVSNEQINVKLLAKKDMRIMHDRFYTITSASVSMTSGCDVIISVEMYSNDVLTRP